MAHVKVNEAQQAGAFNNGAVGQQSRALCPYPYVWDRVRKACVLPDELAWEYAHIDRIPVYNSTRHTSLGANCPEGSGRTAAYTGPLGPDGCRCSPGRVWHDGYCQSPQSVAQQAGSSAQDLAKQYSDPESWATMPLSDNAKQYFAMTKNTIHCKIVQGAVVPGQISSDVMMCSINGGPYRHGAYAVNMNPETAILSERSTVAAENVSASTGITNVWQEESTKAAIKAQTDVAESQLTRAVQQALMPPVSVDTGTQGSGITTLPAPPPGSQPTGDGGYTLPDGSYAAPGTYAQDGGLLGDIPWWVWVAGAGGVYLMTKKR